MNTWQLLKQAQFLAEAQTWTGGTLKVFGSVHVSIAPTEEARKTLRLPMLLLRPLDAISDIEQPDLITQTIQAQIINNIPNDWIGQAVLIGGNRPGGNISSDGRGLLELEEELFNALELLNDIDGVRIQNRARSAAEATLDSVLKYIAWRNYIFEAVVTADRYYHPPRKISATDAGSGNASLTWQLPPSRYDRRQIVLRRAAGSTAPATPTSGTGVTLSGDLATSVTDNPGAGTFSYAVFGAYDETGSGTNQRFSDQEDGTTATVTVT